MKSAYTITNFPLLPINKKEHLQKWANTYFADHLRELGFVSWRSENLSWYKLVGGEVLLTVYLFDSFGYLPMMPCLSYGTHAAFVKPEMPHKVTERSVGGVFETMRYMYFDSPSGEARRKRCPGGLLGRHDGHVPFLPALGGWIQPGAVSGRGGVPG